MSLVLHCLRMTCTFSWVLLSLLSLLDGDVAKGLWEELKGGDMVLSCRGGGYDGCQGGRGFSADVHSGKRESHACIGMAGYQVASGFTHCCSYSISLISVPSYASSQIRSKKGQKEKLISFPSTSFNARYQN
ncbi:hypothetical protein GE09DRAFT_1108978 [Coniochaeta sp. 2T2.1]|nr:hypothetical protein GE09DRAFT_1108978 [Coniochaeta sp. 2T2.1]